MNIADSMINLRQRLAARHARPGTLAMVDKYLQMAEQVGGSEHSSPLKVLHRLMRTPEASRDVGIYDDLVGLEAELEEARQETAREREAMESRPLPKTKKYYKQRKQHERG